MHTADQRAAAVQKRDAVIIDAIKNNLSVKEIAARVGVEEDYAKKLRAQLAEEHGLTIATKARVKGRDKVAPPYGLTQRTRIIRGRLGNKLRDLTERRGIHPVEVALLTGITQTEQTQNKASPYPHDWKLSELERLAALEGKDIIQFLQELLQPKMNGEAL